LTPAKLSEIDPLTERIEAGKLKLPEVKAVSLKSKPITIKGNEPPLASLRQPMLVRSTSANSSEKGLTGGERASKIALREVESTLTTEK
jgi:hypothetical protein